jgi:hypothetical protein
VGLGNEVVAGGNAVLKVCEGEVESAVVVAASACATRLGMKVSVSSHATTMPSFCIVIFWLKDMLVRSSGPPYVASALDATSTLGITPLVTL